MPRQINPKPMTAQIDGDFVVFLIGLRVNAWWKVHKWLPLMKAMPGLLKELDALPPEDTGYLGNIQGAGTTMIQYWRSFDHLEAYARSAEHGHFPVWRAFNQRQKNSAADVGIWHETYLVRAGEYETIYIGMPPHGLGRASELKPVTAELVSARNRARRQKAD